MYRLLAAHLITSESIPLSKPKHGWLCATSQYFLSSVIPNILHCFCVYSIAMHALIFLICMCSSKQKSLILSMAKVLNGQHVVFRPLQCPQFSVHTVSKCLFAGEVKSAHIFILGNLK